MYAPNILKDLGAPRSNYDIELPAGLLLVSPLVSANISSWLWEFKQDIVTPVLASRVLKEYLNLPEATNTDELHLLKLAHIRSDFDRFAPKNVMVYVGEREVMRDDILTLAQTVKQDAKFNVRIRRENFEHDWYFIRELVKPQDKHILHSSDQEFAAFCARSLNEAAENAEKSSSSSSSNAHQLDAVATALLVGRQAHTHPVHLVPKVDVAEVESEAIAVPPITA